jgi:ParB family chromosome partitioning protein
MDTNNIKLDSISVGDGRRRLRDVESLAASISELGLLNPITVSTEHHLIAGYHRLEACRSLGWQEIPANVVSLSEIDSQLAEIDENLVRNELNALERGEQFAKRKELYEAKYPQVKQGARGRGSEKNVKEKDAESAPLSFVKDTAAKTKQSARTISEDVQIASRIPEQVRDLIRDTPLADNKSELLTLSRLDPTTQEEVAERISTGESTTVVGAIRQINSELPEAEKFEPAKTIKNNSGVKWAAALHDLWLQVNAIRDHGGIQQLSAKWSVENRSLYLTEIRDLQSALNKVEKDLYEITNKERAA